MTNESDRNLQSRFHSYIHLGLITFGLRGFSRKRVGGKVFLVLFDDRFSDHEKSIIGLIEADMNNNLGICYICLNFTMLIKDFVKHIKVLIQTKGYEDFSDSNIQLDVVFLGRTTNNMNINYKIKLDEIVSSLQSAGLSFLKPCQLI